MSEPITRPLVDNWPSVPSVKIKTEQEGSTSSNVGDLVGRDKNENDWGPWMTVVGILAGMSLMASIAAWMYWRDERQERLQDRGELLMLVNASESRVLADNMDKNTSFKLMDNRYRELLARLEATEKSHGER